MSAFGSERIFWRICFVIFTIKPSQSLGSQAKMLPLLGRYIALEPGQSSFTLKQRRKLSLTVFLANYGRALGAS